MDYEFMAEAINLPEMDGILARQIAHDVGGAFQNLGYLTIVAGELAYPELNEDELKIMQMATKLDFDHARMVRNTENLMRREAVEMAKETAKKRVCELVISAATRAENLHRDLMEINLENVRAESFEKQHLKSTLEKLAKTIMEIPYSSEDKEYAMGSILHDVLPIYKTKMNEKGIDFEITAKDFFSLPKVKTQRILNNLLSNALKFTEQGKISIEARKEDNNAIITVSDTGNGISEDDLEKVRKGIEFTHGGHGIGLTSVKAMVEKMNGIMEVESRTEGEDKGSKFTITIPLKEKEIKL